MEVKDYLSNSSHKQPFLSSFSKYCNSRLTAAIVSLHFVYETTLLNARRKTREHCAIFSSSIHCHLPTFWSSNSESQVRISSKEQEPCAVPWPAPPCLCIPCFGWGRSRLVCQQAQMRKWAGDGSCNESHLPTQKLIKFPIRIIYHGKLFVQSILFKINYFYEDKL